MEECVGKTYKRAWKYRCRRAGRMLRARMKRNAKRRFRHAWKIAVKTGGRLRLKHLPLIDTDVI